MSMHPSINYFKEYKGDCDCFVETGTNTGDGVTLAVLAGFTGIHTIDIKNQLDPTYRHGLKEIYYYIGDSAEVLNELLPKLKDKKIMFWLDAHSNLIDEEDNFPLLNELDIIEKYRKRKNDIILIDDLLYMTHPDVTGFDRFDDIENQILRINLAYRFEYLPNPIKNNILMARI